MMNFRVQGDLKDQFEKAVELVDLNGSQVLRDFMRNYVESAREKREYEAWLVENVQKGLMQVASGRTIPHEELKAKAAARRERMLGGNR
ncbi:MAG: hypothetical protein LBM64_07615 [Deltaproteobacteria bacterium]|jgi:predicted transcriptional regulator|nr:hypothetical protein [Deltaproteobacteria bacterium]